MLINAVAPFAGAWIEMAFVDDEQQKAQVAPFAGAWIEILKLLCICWVPLPSLPSRERGLKYKKGQAENVCPLSLPSRERGLK